MIRVLLDHPWPIEEAFDGLSECSAILLHFAKLIERHRLIPVPFIDSHERDSALAKIKWRHSGGAAIHRFVSHCIRTSTSEAMATPVPEPSPALGVHWKRALRDELANLEKWRVPQIIVCRSRSNVWPQAREVQISLDDRAGVLVRRVLVRLDDYDSHEFALSDFDPWTHLQHRHPPMTGNRVSHPCILPRPESLNGISLSDFSQALEIARQLGWRQGSKYYFIPPADYEVEAVERDQWRKGHGFRIGRTPDNRAGPIDYKGQIWVWDQAERHWDVQFSGGAYARISHNGSAL